MQTIFLWIIAFMLTVFVIVRIIELKKLKDINDKVKWSKVEELLREINIHLRDFNNK